MHSHLNVKSPVETKTTSSVQVLLFALILTAASLVLYNLSRWQDTNILIRFSLLCVNQIRNTQKPTKCTSVFMIILFTMFSLNCFGCCCGHLQGGDVITIQVYKCGWLCRHHSKTIKNV